MNLAVVLCVCALLVGRNVLQAYMRLQTTTNLDGCSCGYCTALFLPTNGRLFLYGTLLTDNCVRCSGVRESLLHLFWQCPAVLHFWDQLTRILSLGTQLTAQSVMLRSKLGRSCAPEKQIYVCILLGKWYIWRCRFNKTKPNIQGFIHMGIDYIRVERYAAMVTDSIDKFNCNWFQLNEILKNSQHPP